MSLILPPLLSFILTLLLLVGVKKYFPRLGLLDRPHEYGITGRKPIPYSAGIVFFIVMFIFSLIFVKLSAPIIALLAAGALITAISFIDDRRRLSPWLRLGVQIVAACLLIFAGVKIQIISNPFGQPFRLDTIVFSVFGQTIWLLSSFLIIGWLVVMMNAMNWLDGIPGLASGISAIAQAAIFLLSLEQFHVVDQSAIITLASVLAAACFAFVFFDFYPPKLLMGDTGSMFLGFMLGSLSILAGGKMATALLIMGFPVLDAVFVTLRRLFSGKNPLKGDYNHLHHRLLHAGLSPRRALVVNYFFCALFAAIALTLTSTLYKLIAFGGVFFLLSVVALYIVAKTKKGPEN